MVQFSLAMGQNSSLPKPGRRKSLKSFGHRSNSRHNNLSHTFTINDSDDKIEQVNINLASEEILMTLDGINRDLARSIVEHRKAIGRFRKVEDLVLVLGADRLEKIKPEICVSYKKAGSTSSRAQSYDSLKSTDSRLTVRSNKLVNINKASVFELQCVHGISQEIAANIVHHREKKGQFKKIEDVLKVKGIDRMRLDNIVRFLTVEEDNEIQSDQELSKPSILSNGFHVASFERRLNGGPHRFGVPNGLPLSSVIDIFELLSAYSPRPILEEAFTFTRNGEVAIRIGTWNLNGFSTEKANNLGVREVICRTLLENGLSILAVQGVTNVESLRTICDELNKPKLRRVEEWKDRNHNWNFCMLDIEDASLGFIYDSDGAIDVELISLRQGPSDSVNMCETLIGRFSIGTLDLQLVNMKIKSNVTVEVLDVKIKELLSEEEMVLLLVDFSDISNYSDKLSSVGGLHAVFPSSTSTSYLPGKMDVSSTANILSSRRAKSQLTGINGVVKQGLTHLAIPNGWSWGGPVSPCCPLWVELFVSSNAGTAL